MSFIPEAEIDMRAQEVFDLLDEQNPSVNQMAEWFEDYVDMVSEQFYDNSYEDMKTEGLSADDEEFMHEWFEARMDAVIRRWQQKVAYREMEISEPQ